MKNIDWGYKNVSRLENEKLFFGLQKRKNVSFSFISWSFLWKIYSGERKSTKPKPDGILTANDKSPKNYILRKNWNQTIF